MTWSERMDYCRTHAAGKWRNHHSFGEGIQSSGRSLALQVARAYYHRFCNVGDQSGQGQKSTMLATLKDTTYINLSKSFQTSCLVRAFQISDLFSLRLDLGTVHWGRWLGPCGLHALRLWFNAQNLRSQSLRISQIACPSCPISRLVSEPTRPLQWSMYCTGSYWIRTLFLQISFFLMPSFGPVFDLRQFFGRLTCAFCFQGLTTISWVKWLWAQGKDIMGVFHGISMEITWPLVKRARWVWCETCDRSKAVWRWAQDVTVERTKETTVQLELNQRFFTATQSIAPSCIISLLQCVPICFTIDSCKFKDLALLIRSNYKL